jgi:SAM-dependent methyltransferase
MSTEQTAANAAFWNEPCGSHAARVLGVKDASIESLKRFDDWYFGFYPYLASRIPFAELRGKDVLEVGLGYGTVSQRIAETGCNYAGLDIASGPVRLVNQRLLQNHLRGHAKQGDILEPPFKEGSFDFIVAIGCLHHTGDLAQALARCFDLLRKGGTLIVMVYSAYSYRRWKMAFGATLRYWFDERRGYRGVIASHRASERAAYDTDSSGTEAPHTDFISKRSLASMCATFAEFDANYENIDNGFPFWFAPRRILLRTAIPKIVGLDLYARVVR